ncbi:hypothetical protein [Streptomyces sp. NPDC012888]|uniref:hypothetical protein n=1 Tax=Streptomyces sp. NPDC012888 TaxID=3364855 RepID=UPI0036CD934A
MLVTLGAGVMLGALGALAGKCDGPFFHAVSIVFSAGWSWACFGLLVGFLRPPKSEAAWLAPSALALGVVVYYLLKALSPVTPIGVDGSFAPSGGGDWSKVVVWGVLAFVFGAPLGIIGNLARIPGIAGFPFRLLGPLIAFFETSWRLDVEAATAGPGVAPVWSGVRALAVLAAVAVLAHVVWEWRTRRSRRRVVAGSD